MVVNVMCYFFETQCI